MKGVFQSFLSYLKHLIFNHIWIKLLALMITSLLFLLARNIV